jgi:hypothetical protein
MEMRENRTVSGASHVTVSRYALSATGSSFITGLEHVAARADPVEPQYVAVSSKGQEDAQRPGRLTPVINGA